MPHVFRNYRANGRFDFDFGIQVQSDFEIHASSDARIEVGLTVPPTKQTMEIFNKNLVKPVEATVAGQIVSPNHGSLKCNRLILDQIEIPTDAKLRPIRINMTFISAKPITIDCTNLQQSIPVELHHGLTNFFFDGCQASNSTALPLSFDQFSAKTGGVLVTYRKLAGYDKKAENARHDIVLTSEAIVQLKPIELEQANGVIFDALMLLSLASGNYVASIYEDLFQNGVLVRTILKPVKTMPCTVRDTCIDTKNSAPCDLQVFLETSFSSYENLKSDLGLNVVIEYYVQTKQTVLLQHKYLIGVVGIECLLSYVPSYFSKIGKWNKRRTFLEWFRTRVLKRGRRSLRQKITLLLEHFSVPYGKTDLAFVKRRHALVHTGDFPKSVDGVKAYGELVQFLDRILLRILGYHGKHYLNRLNDFRRELVP